MTQSKNMIYTLISQFFDEGVLIQLSQFWILSLAFSNIRKAIKWLQNYDKPQNTSISKFSTEHKNVAKNIEYLEQI
jgi:hypothetical protein